MKLVVGLGNPGPQYAHTRHNIGFRVVDALAERMRVEFDGERFAGRYREGVIEGEAGAHRVGVLQPLTFMNRSGESVLQACAELGSDSAHSLELSPPPLAPEQCMVVYDDLDLALGRIRLRASGGAGGHNGIASVTEALETRAVPRLRFGISRPPAGSETIEYVLGAFAPDEQKRLPDALERACDALECWIRSGIAEAMSIHNAEPPEEPAGEPLRREP